MLDDKSKAIVIFDLKASAHVVFDKIFLPGVHLPHVLARVVHVSVFAAVNIRNRSNECGGGTASTSRLVELVRRDVYLTDDVTVVGMVQSYHVLVACTEKYFMSLFKIISKSYKYSSAVKTTFHKSMLVTAGGTPQFIKSNALRREKQR